MKPAKDHWRELCIAAAFEYNPESLAQLVAEINKELADRQEELTDRLFEKLATEPINNPRPNLWVH